MLSLRVLPRAVASLALSLTVACASDALRARPDEAQPGLLVSPAAISFGAVAVGCAATAEVRLANVGDIDLVVVEPPAIPAWLLIGAEWPLQLAAGDSITLQLLFAPTALGDAGTSLSFAAFEEDASASLEVSGTGADVEATPLDLAFVIDISTSMDTEMARLHEAVGELLDVAETEGLDLNIGLTTFVNDVVLHGEGEPLSRELFFFELESQLQKVSGEWVTNASLQRNVDNQDIPENSLDALYRTATEFQFRTGSLRFVVLITDDTFLEPPAVYTGNHPAVYTYAETAAALVSADTRLFAIHRNNNACGQSWADPCAPGYSEPYAGQPSLVDQTDGRSFDILGVVNGSLSLSDILVGLVRDPCGS